MTDYLSELGWLESVAEGAAEEMVEHRGIIEEHVSNLRHCEHPYTNFAFISFIPKIESIRCGMFEVAHKEESYSFRILHRSLIEHYCKFMYIWFRYAEERADDVGREYYIFGTAKENLDYIKAMQNSAEMLGGVLARPPIEVINDLHPLIDNMSSTQLRRVAAKFTYKNTAQYIHHKMAKPEHTECGLMVSVIPLYSELSSFVHGGPSSLSFCKELEDPDAMYSNIIESLSVAQMMALHVQAMTFLMCYQKNKKFGDPYNVMTKYIEQISKRES
jgi:hypothetical protein